MCLICEDHTPRPSGGHHDQLGPSQSTWFAGSKACSNRPFRLKWFFCAFRMYDDGLLSRARLQCACGKCATSLSLVAVSNIARWTSAVLGPTERTRQAVSSTPHPIVVKHSYYTSQTKPSRSSHYVWVWYVPYFGKLSAPFMLSLTYNPFYILETRIEIQ